MDPKEYAARLQRMQDEIETAKAREQISNGYNKAMETSPMVDTTERLYAEFKAAKKPAAKKSASVSKPSATAPAERDIPKEMGYRGKYAKFAPQAPYDPSESGMTPEDWQDYEALAQRGRIPHYMRRGEFKPVDRPVRRAMGVLPAAVAEGKAKLAPTVNAVKDTVKPAAVAKPVPAEKLTPAEERIKGVTAAQAEAILSDVYSTRGKHGQYTPDEAALIEALRGRASGFDYSKAKQAPAAPYVPSFLGGKK